MAVFSQIQIVNLALARIGEPPIVSFDDANTAAKSAETIYPLMVASLQRRYRWNFCKKRAVLAPLADELPFGEFKVYQKPTDLVSVVGAYESRWGGEAAYSAQRDLLRVEGDKILWPGETLNLYYIRRVDQESLFDAVFVEALAWAIARDLALSVANDQGKAQMAEQMFQRTIKTARTSNALETAPEPIVASEWLDGRWAGGFGYREWNRHSATGQPKTSPVTAPTPPTDTWEFD